MVLENAPPPKKLFPIFEKKTKGSKQSGKADVVVTSPVQMKTPLQEVMNDRSTSEPAGSRQTRSPSVSIIPALPVYEGSSREAPIVIEPISPAPESTNAPLRPAKPMYSIFNKPNRASGSGSSKLTASFPPAVPSRDTQPGLDWIAFPAIQPQFPSRSKGKAKEVDTTPAHDILSQLCSTFSDTSNSQSIISTPLQDTIDVQDYIATIPQAHLNIPSIIRLLQVAEYPSTDAQPSSEQWSDKWRPRRADHVLGNEQHALYLRDWLQALRLEGESMRPVVPAPTKNGQAKKRKVKKGKKPDIVRHVKKRRRDNLEDDFLAPDDLTEDEEDYGLDMQSSDWDDFAFCREMDAKINESTDGSRGSSPLSAIGEDSPAISYKPTRFGRQISNTILLAGPSSSGKTAAVYACAEELGWEVFEVYPGIGERSGTELNKLIGDVGKNHTVKVQQTPKKSRGKSAFFQKQTEPVIKRTRRVLDSDDDIDLIGSASVATREVTPELLVGEPVVNQSVILIEEADVLYQTDTNFWPALVNIIKQCRRPVILTCNGMSSSLGVGCVVLMWTLETYPSYQGMTCHSRLLWNSVLAQFPRQLRICKPFASRSANRLRETTS